MESKRQALSLQGLSWKHLLGRFTYLVFQSRRKYWWRTHLPQLQSAAECEMYEMYCSVSLLLWLGSSDPEITKGTLEGIEKYLVENYGNIPRTSQKGGQGRLQMLTLGSGILWKPIFWIHELGLPYKYSTFMYSLFSFNFFPHTYMLANTILMMLILAFQFNDILLYTSRGLTASNQFKVHGHLPLYGMTVSIVRT